MPTATNKKSFTITTCQNKQNKAFVLQKKTLKRRNKISKKIII